MRRSLFSILLVCLPLLAQTYKISTIAGGGLPENIPALSAFLPDITGVAAARDGSVYFSVAAYDIVLKLDSQGRLTRVAGSGVPGFSGDGGPAVEARLNFPSGLALDEAGNLYVADTGNLRVRRVSGGVMTTFAGTGNTGVSRDEAPALEMKLSTPSALAWGGADTLYVATSSVVYEVKGGVARRIAGRLDQPSGFGGDGGPATQARLRSIRGLAVNANGDLYIADSENHRVRRVSSGTITTFAGTGLTAFNGDGLAPTQTNLHSPNGLAFDANGDLLIAAYGPGRIRKVANGTVSTYAGGGDPAGPGPAGPATGVYLGVLGSLAMTPSGDLLAVVNYSLLLKIASGTSSIFAGGGGPVGDGGDALSAQLGSLGQMARGPKGEVYFIDASLRRVRMLWNGTVTTVAGNGSATYNGDDIPAVQASLGIPESVAVDAQGNLYIADSWHHRVRKVSNGIITTIAGTGTPGGSDPRDQNALATSVNLTRPTALAFDRDGVLFIGESGGPRVSKLIGGKLAPVAGTGIMANSPDGTPALEARLYEVTGLAVDSKGVLYIHDGGARQVRKVVDGILLTAASATEPLIDLDRDTSPRQVNPLGIAVDVDDSLLIADLVDSRIRRVRAGVMESIAGSTNGYSGDGGPALSAQLAQPGGLLVEPDGRILIADRTNNNIRQLTPDGPHCSYTLSVPVLDVPREGGTFDVHVATQSGCGWSRRIVSGSGPYGSEWLSITSGNGQRGSGLVTLRVAVNPGSIRTAQVEIAGLRLTVIQQAEVPCQVVPATSSVTFPKEGGPQHFLMLVKGNCSDFPPITGLPDWMTEWAADWRDDTYMVNLTASPNPGAARSAEISIAGTKVMVSQLGAQAAEMTRMGSLAQIASGETWKTTVTLTNMTRVPSRWRMTFRTSVGLAMTLPWKFQRQDSSGTAIGSVLEGTLNADESMNWETEAPLQATAATGWALLEADQDVRASAVFRQKVGDREQEAVVPLDTGAASRALLAYDNAEPYTTGMAIANLTAATKTVELVLRNEQGAIASRTNVTLPPYGHQASVLSGFAGQSVPGRGMVECITPAANEISMVGLRFHSGGAFTTVPPITGGAALGVMPQIASAGSWRTTVTMVNPAVTSASAKLRTFDSFGVPLDLPWTWPGQSTTGTELNRAVPGGAVTYVETTGPESQETKVGWAELSSNLPIGGFAVFQQTLNGRVQEAVVPMDSSTLRTHTFTFDERDGYVTGIALANRTAETVYVFVDIRAMVSGMWLDPKVIALPPHGHRALQLNQLYDYSTGDWGTVSFSTEKPGAIAALGLRFHPKGAFTTMPAMSK